MRPASFSVCIAPHASLMFRPSGSAASVSTLAPSRPNAAGAAREVAPLAQSSNTLRPLRSRANVELNSRR